MLEKKICLKSHFMGREKNSDSLYNARSYEVEQCPPSIRNVHCPVCPEIAVQLSQRARSKNVPDNSHIRFAPLLATFRRRKRMKGENTACSLTLKSAFLCLQLIKRSATNVFADAQRRDRKQLCGTCMIYALDQLVCVAESCHVVQKSFKFRRLSSQS